jgi:hypothetical protein
MFPLDAVKALADPKTSSAITVNALSEFILTFGNFIRKHNNFFFKLLLLIMDDLADYMASFKLLIQL